MLIGLSSIVISRCDAGRSALVFQDYPLENQITYFNNLTDADIIFAHNESDSKYFRGLVDNADVRVLRSLMIEDAVGDIDNVNRSGVMIGGNFVSWYGGFDL